MRFSLKLSVVAILIILIPVLLVLFSCILRITAVSENSYNFNSLGRLVSRVMLVNTESKKPEISDELFKEVMPNLMQSFNISSIEIFDITQSEPIFTIKNNQIDPSSFQYIFSLRSTSIKLNYPELASQHYVMIVTYPSPVVSAFFSLNVIFFLIITLFSIIIIIVIVVHYLNPRLGKILFSNMGEDEQLEIVSSIIPSSKNIHTRTPIHAKIMDFFIRDPETGVSTRFAFDQQLAAQLEEVNAYGVVMMIQLPDFDLYRKPISQNSEIDELQQILINMLITYAMRFNVALLARYFENTFVFLLPHATVSDADKIASQLITSINSISLDVNIERNTWMYIGITTYDGNQTQEEIMDSVREATRNAEHQGGNSWYLYNNTHKDPIGSVRWYTLLSRVLERSELIRFYEEPAILTNGRLHHRDIAVRIYDGKEELLASEFMPWLQRLNMVDTFDKHVIDRLFPLLRYWQHETIAFQISVSSLINPTFFEWLCDVLQEKGKTQCNRIVFELVEADVERNLDKLTPIIRTLKHFGCQIAVMQAGIDVVNTSYINLLLIDIIKLYSGIIRSITRQPENQLIVESLCAMCFEHNVGIFATGIRTHSEWDALINLGISGGQGGLFAPLERLPHID